MATKAYYISLDKLRIGMFVILEISWFAHNFTRNRFKIKSSRQIDAIKHLGLEKIRIDPSKCDVTSLQDDPPPQPETLSTASPNDVEQQNAVQKIQHIEDINRHRAHVVDCEKNFVRASSVIKNINTKIFAQPEQAYSEASDLIDQMIASMVTERDVTVNLMSDKAGGEEMYQHSLNVAVLAMMLAKELGMPAEDIKHLGMGCLFHDVGKLDIPQWIVTKTTSRNRNENALLQMHCKYGEPIAKKLGLGRQEMFIILQHHERVDGSGYPDKIKGEEISRLARIAAIVNAFDNYCNPSNPSNSLSPYAALAHMFAKERSKFENVFLTTFIRCMGVYPPGTVVLLSDGSYAMVISVNFNKPLLPVVLVHDPDIPRNEAIILDLQNELDISIQKVIPHAQLPGEVCEYLGQRKRLTYYFHVPENLNAASA